MLGLLATSFVTTGAGQLPAQEIKDVAAELRQQLTRRIDREFDLRQQRQSQEIDRQAKRLDRLRSLILDRASRKDELVRQRVNRLLSPDDEISSSPEESFELETYDSAVEGDAAALAMELKVRKVEFDLAQSELATALEANRAVPNSFGQTELLRLEAAMRVAEARRDYIAEKLGGLNTQMIRPTFSAPSVTDAYGTASSDLAYRTNPLSLAGRSLEELQMQRELLTIDLQRAEAEVTEKKKLRQTLTEMQKVGSEPPQFHQDLIAAEAAGERATLDARRIHVQLAYVVRQIEKLTEAEKPNEPAAETRDR